jgi:uncharacterized protein YdaU (DUF1376 family)
LCYQWAKGSIPDDIETLARVSGGRRPSVERVLSKFERNEDGTYGNNRLEQERLKQMDFRKTRSENAKNRWSRCNARAFENDERVHESSICKTNALRTSSSDSTLSAQNAQGGEFEKFWEAYPRKRGRDKAIKAWKVTAKKRPSLEKILAQLEAQKSTHDRQKEDGQYIPYPATWLNQGRWDDELLPVVAAPAQFARTPHAPDPEKAQEWALANAPDLSGTPFNRWHPGYQQDFFKANGN